MTFQLLIGISATLWLASIVFCVLALRWSFTGAANRFAASLILSVIALAMGYYGLTHFHVNASKTVNGHTVWAFNSRWFFITTLVLAALTLACTIWKSRKNVPAVLPDQHP